MTEDARSYITDPKALRALSHPTRWTIIELLGAERTATATRCAEYSGESVASCSYHLGMLAKYGFVEPAEGGDGREKPWRLTRRDQSWRAADLEPDAAMAAETLSEVFLDHEVGQIKDWVRRASRESAQWQEAAGMSGRALYCTPDELVALQAGFDELVAAYRARDDDPAARPDGARLVRLLLSGRLVRARSDDRQETP
ncbi:winged helix-turn-helix domain-containing protein [Pseudonocardia abyssalis]|uniref:Winged helix-turn-helix transcriptional regulator n=1 Tax=Pseudonocardia abyssalis TaxID=2792008 RepID=A0ABS6UUT6_9PSEU|nr:winged helix-turn-helix domain-containing protein [Pseudonocardia abyssalis]MBW0117735.1 winged helix-turn-helix transcriptional regulator [Pseudonocardia abyssalis]MBW0135932.1 winged helix-turn-helix transcriptional regulator [Pseudonocardia abyssalis]